MPSNKHTHAENTQWHNELPAKHLSASVLCWNADGALLFVLPSYESWWTLPGGVVEKNESPLLAAARELKEETGLDISSRRLQFAGVNYAHPYKEWHDFLHFFFTVGALTKKEIAAIGQTSEKMHGCQFLFAEQLPSFVAPFRLDALRQLFEYPQTGPVYIETEIK